MATPYRRTFPAVLLACLLPLAACGDRSAPGDGAQDDGFVARTTRQAVERAREQIATGNVSVGGKGGTRFSTQDAGGATDHLPRAEISPEGDFIVDGEAVAVDAAKRGLLLAHRANLLAIADAGIEVGIQGATLGLGAARGAVGAALGGRTDALEARMKAEGERIEAAAMRICDLLPPLLESQRALAEALPDFAPYATMTAADVDDCREGRQAPGDTRDVAAEAAAAGAEAASAPAD